MNNHVSRTALLVLFFSMGLFLLGSKSTEELSDAMTAKVSKGDLKVDVETKGVFQAQDKTEILVEPLEYKGDLIVTKILPEGAKIKKDDVLLEFEAKDLKKALSNAEDEIADAKSKRDRAVADLESAKVEKETAMAAAAKEFEMAQSRLLAEQENQQTEQEKKELDIKRNVDSLRDAQINLEQLLKMYDERELHTDTEKILVEREKRSLENAKISHEFKLRDFEHWKKFDKTLAIEGKQLEVDRKSAEEKKTRFRVEADVKEKEAAAEKAERKVVSTEKVLEGLKKDEQNLKLIAPRDGILFYGSMEDSSGDFFVIGLSRDMKKNLRIGGRIATHTPLFTIASMENLSIRMQVLENDIQHMREGLEVSVIPDAYPNLTIKGKLDKVAHVATGGLFSERRMFTVEASYEGNYPQLRAGMNCKVTVHAASISDCVLAPVPAVRPEGGDYYCLVNEGGKPVKRKIKIGASSDSSVQILEGLKPGESVYLYDPRRE